MEVISDMEDDFAVFDGPKHVFELGEGTVAKGWLDEAIDLYIVKVIVY